MEPMEMYKLLNNTPLENRIVKKSDALTEILIGLSVLAIGFILYKNYKLYDSKNN